jgi:hypothetical protein
VNRDGEPKRLRSLAPPGSLLGRGLTAARGRGPSEAELRALGGAVFGASAVGIGAATKAGAASVKVAGLTKATLALAVAGTLAGTAGVVMHHWQRPPSIGVKPSTPAPTRAAEPRPGPEVVPLALPADIPIPGRPSSHVERRRLPPSPVAARPQPATIAAEMPPATGPAAQTPSDADEELRLVEAAQRALPRDPALALALAREHARRFPDGALAQERDAVAISALWETGRHDEARELARRFTEEHPGSTYVGRMREILRRPESPAP